MTKSEIRNYVREAIASLGNNERRVLDEHLCAQILSRVRALPVGSPVLLFSPLADEPQIQKAIEVLYSEGYRVLMPVVQGDDIVLRAYCGAGSLKLGAYGILEPIPAESENETKFEPVLAFVPGRAFTISGQRLGRGKGYYDRYLAAHPTHTIGIGYPLQILDTLPVDPHDIPLNELIY